MNGLHSKRKLHEHYPEFGQNILRHIYKGIPPSFSKNQTAVQLMKNVDFDDFTNKTSIDFKVLGCRYMNKYCVRYWKTVKTRFGYCREFSPELLTKDTFSNGQKLSLSLVMGYDQDDASIGWYYFLSGKEMELITIFNTLVQEWHCILLIHSNRHWRQHNRLTYHQM